MNQAEAAKAFEIPFTHYVAMERGVIAPAGAALGAVLRTRELTAAECCILYRQRSGMKQREVAEELGVSRLWVNRMERGIVDCHILVDYWEC